jgi:hypothetical protein
MNMRRKLMNEHKERKMLVIDINLTRSVVTLAISGLILAAGLGFLALEARGVAASNASSVLEVPQAAPAVSSNGLRRYYRTADTYTPTFAINACATGYHFASLWEILDTSNLEYANEHIDALTPVDYDMGEGPPVGAGGLGLVGWIRTGYNKSTTGVEGQANCDAWTSVNPAHYGTQAGLSYEWGAGTTEDIFVWNVMVGACDYSGGVWCVED